MRGVTETAPQQIAIYRLADAVLRASLRRLPPGRPSERLALWWGYRYRASERVVRSRYGALMHVNPNDYIDLMLYYFGTFEPHCLTNIMRHCPEDGTFIDVGANIGAFSIEVARYLAPRGRVISIEAAPPNASALRRNINLNGLTNIDVIEAAAGESAGTAMLTKPHAGNRGMFTIGGVAGLESYPVTVRTIDSIVRELNPTRVDVIKIDIEGAEYGAMRGALDTIESYRPAIVTEVNAAALRQCGASAEALLELLASLGYSGWLIRADNLLPIKATLLSGCDECLFLPA